jgi:hypothetical protein
MLTEIGMSQMLMSLAVCLVKICKFQKVLNDRANLLKNLKDAEAHNQ